MKARTHRSITALLYIAIVAFATPVSAAPPSDLDATVKKAMQQFEIPGAMLALVEPGRAPLTKGYGVRKLGESAPMNEHTLFAIASNSKAFTAAALAILVDEGKLGWDDKVADRLPGFRMYDPYASHEMTVRDLLVHRSGLGLGAGDMLFWPQTLVSREDLVQRLRYIPPATSFRSGYAYDNILYVVAGRVIEAVSGQSWENFIVERIFKPLGMNESAPSATTVKSNNRSTPHARLNGRSRNVGGTVEPLEEANGWDNAAPAGGINASPHDMVRWLQLQLDRGVMGNSRLFSEASAKEMWTPQMLVPIGTEHPAVAAILPKFHSYGLGWNIQDYRGHLVVTHQGFLEGAASVTFLIPDKKVGFIIMINSEDTEARDSISYSLLDHYLGVPKTDWVGAFNKAYQAKQADAIRVLDAADAPAKTAKGPSLDTAAYAGTYRDAWYGDVVISNSNGKLNIDFKATPGMSGPLEHLRLDTFRTRFTNRRMEDAYVTFSFKPDGSIEHAKLLAISPLADFSFDFHDLLLKPVAR
ncbi:serine hydrolase [Steroidobacter sp.]|uniref:serine hydrolase n=1 Tax=Steroidobacter sp. TaxID=1978227 RepID=UPI001A5335C6|nr:serine hydrolase [Steroidobacter sp.]MBL8266516.1 serine hydrolase [Steroidobacter sp.]